MTLYNIQYSINAVYRVVVLYCLGNDSKNTTTLPLHRAHLAFQGTILLWSVAVSSNVNFTDPGSCVLGLNLRKLPTFN